MHFSQKVVEVTLKKVFLLQIYRPTACPAYLHLEQIFSTYFPCKFTRILWISHLICHNIIF